jgi:hypothetical protein
MLSKPALNDLRRSRSQSNRLVSRPNRAPATSTQRVAKPQNLFCGDMLMAVEQPGEVVCFISYKERGYISADRRHYLAIHNQQALAKRC